VKISAPPASGAASPGVETVKGVFAEAVADPAVREGPGGEEGAEDEGSVGEGDGLGGAERLDLDDVGGAFALADRDVLGTKADRRGGIADEG
jgi:hypothetical protein